MTGRRPLTGFVGGGADEVGFEGQTQLQQADGALGGSGPVRGPPLRTGALRLQTIQLRLQSQATLS